MLAHKASHEARVAVEAALGHKVAFEPRALIASSGQLSVPWRARQACVHTASEVSQSCHGQ